MYREVRLMKTAEAQKGNSSVLRALDLIELLITSPDALSIADICRKLGLNRVTCVSMLNTLMLKKYVYKNADGHYLISGKIYVMAKLYRESFPVIDPFNIVAGEFTKELGCSATLSVISDFDRALVISQVPEPTVYISAIKQLYYPLHCTASGKVLLSHRPPKQLQSTLDSLTLRQYTSQTITDRDKLMIELAATRERGYGIDNREYFENTICIGAPVFDRTGNVAFAVSFTDIKLDDEQTIEWYVPRIKNLAKSLSYSIGYRDKKLDIF